MLKKMIAKARHSNFCPSRFFAWTAIRDTKAFVKPFRGGHSFILTFLPVPIGFPNDTKTMSNPQLKPAPTQSELDRYVGRKGYFQHGKMQVPITVLEAKLSYSHVRLLCKPRGGVAAWKNVEKLVLDQSVNHKPKEA